MAATTRQKARYISLKKIAKKITEIYITVKTLAAV
jgi:hypothetical protein